MANGDSGAKDATNASVVVQAEISSFRALRDGKDHALRAASAKGVEARKAAVAARKAAGVPTLRQAVNAFCRTCIASDAGSRWLEVVEACTADGRGGYDPCPLYPVRPRSPANGRKANRPDHV